MPFHPKIGGGSAIAGTWKKFTLSTAEFTDAATSQTITLLSAQSNKVVLGAIVHLVEPWDASGISAANLSVGVTDYVSSIAGPMDVLLGSANQDDILDANTLQRVGEWLSTINNASVAYFLGQVAGMTEDVEVDADNAGTIGNSILLEFNGSDTIADVVAAWNLANPSNTATVISGDDTQVPDSGTSMQLAEGAEKSYEVEDVPGDITATLTFTGADIDTATQGYAEVWVLLASIPR